MIKVETINDKLNIYETLHNYFANYVFKYMEYYYNVTSWENIDNSGVLFVEPPTRTNLEDNILK